mmetsp:Transcript_60012/g.147580  ORF Transcript_60012/g.147580 Transcript_60012/m.147580 type:complete len:110 (+) Transcript_60012:528-857(+)
MQVRDFLPESSEGVNLAGMLSYISLVLVIVRTCILFLVWGCQWFFGRKNLANVAPGTPELLSRGSGDNLEEVVTVPNRSSIVSAGRMQPEKNDIFDAITPLAVSQPVQA